MRVSLVAVITLALAFGVAAPIEAKEGTRCKFEFEVVLSPGLWMSPNSGPHATRDPGTLTCKGLVNGKQPTRAGTLGDEGRYGTKDPDSCSGGEGYGVDTLKVPTAGGLETVVSEFTF